MGEDREGPSLVTSPEAMPVHLGIRHHFALLGVKQVGSLGSVIVVSNQSSNAACRVVQEEPRVIRPAS
jgi:hypothetical protein